MPANVFCQTESPSYEHIAKTERNTLIHAYHQAGGILEEITSKCGISVQRVHPIIYGGQN